MNRADTTKFLSNLLIRDRFRGMDRRTPTRTRVVWKKNGWVTIESGSVDQKPLDDFDTEHFEVVGNVFDNPELLEV